MQELTRAQEEYFKGSAIRGRDGQLVVCYHLTNAEFDTFDKDKIGGHNAFYGKGFRRDGLPQSFLPRTVSLPDG